MQREIIATVDIAGGGKSWHCRHLLSTDAIAAHSSAHRAWLHTQRHREPAKPTLRTEGERKRVEGSGRRQPTEPS